MKSIQPVSLLALLTTLVLLFAFQGQQILAQPLVIALLAVPILIQVYFNAGLAYWHAGVLANSIASEALTSVLIAINKRYKVAGSGIRITGVPSK